MRPVGIEPTHPVPETGALSPELRAHDKSKNIKWFKKHFTILSCFGENINTIVDEITKVLLLFQIFDAIIKKEYSYEHYS